MYPQDPQATDGKRCSICSVTYERRIGTIAKVVDVDHTDPADCIRALAKLVRALEKLIKPK